MSADNDVLNFIFDWFNEREPDMVVEALAAFDAQSESEEEK